MHATACFGLLYELIDKMEYGDEIVFGDEIGSWMIPGDEKQYLTAYITAVAQTASPDEFTAVVVPLARRDSHQSLTGEVYATACHLSNVAQKEKLGAEIERLNIRTERSTDRGSDKGGYLTQKNTNRGFDKQKALD